MQGRLFGSAQVGIQRYLRRCQSRKDILFMARLRPKLHARTTPEALPQIEGIRKSSHRRHPEAQSHWTGSPAEDMQCLNGPEGSMQKTSWPSSSLKHGVNDVLSRNARVWLSVRGTTCLQGEIVAEIWGYPLSRFTHRIRY